MQRPAALSLPGDQIETARHAPVMATLGLPFTITELASREALAACQSNIAAFRAGNEKYPGALDFAQFVYWRGPDALHARMFAPLDNIPEDPATGSAAATLAAYLARQDGHDVELTLHQGVDMGRPSIIELRTQGDRVTVSGKAVLVMEGKLHLPG